MRTLSQSHKERIRLGQLNRAPISEETRQKMRESAKKRPKIGVVTKRRLSISSKKMWANPETRATIIKSREKDELTEDHKSNISRSLKVWWSGVSSDTKAKRIENMGFGMSGVRSKPTLYKGFKFRSKAEATMACALDSADYRWMYEKLVIPHGDVTFIPDFWLIDLKMLIEVSGEHFDWEEKQSKMESAKLAGYEIMEVQSWQMENWSPYLAIENGNLDESQVKRKLSSIQLNRLLIKHFSNG